jgi:adenylyltransferase/sulfurtransferase
MNYIDANELKTRLDQGEAISILDVREDYETSICSIGGVHIPMSEVKNRIHELDGLEEIVVLCRTGKRAEAVANLLIKDFNFNNVLVLNGGIQSWIDTIDTSLESY